MSKIQDLQSPRGRTWVMLVDRGKRPRPRYLLRRTLPDGRPQPRPERFDDPGLARRCAEKAVRILGYPLIRVRCGRPR